MTESKTRIAVRRALAGEPVAQLAAELGLYASGIHRAVAKEREVKRCPTCARVLPKGFATPPTPAQAAYAEAATLPEQDWTVKSALRYLKQQASERVASGSATVPELRRAVGEVAAILER